MRTMGRRLVMVAMGAVSCWASQAGAEPGGLPLCQAQLSACKANQATCTANLNACNAALAAAQQFPATGQTTCSNSAGTVIGCTGTGQDGEIRAGAALSYTDNGDGTITDNSTRLMWEKKSDDGSIHDKDLVYTWAEAFAIHIGALNTAAFAEYTDWRLPNVKEMQSIVNYENLGPAVSPAFNTDCAAACTMLTCSCTKVGPYWTSSSSANDDLYASIINLGDGVVGNTGYKPGTLFVRAVRGGL